MIVLKKSALPISQDALDQVFEAAAGMCFAALMDCLWKIYEGASRIKHGDFISYLKYLNMALA